MKAVVLAGGQGTRLRPLTFSIPKPLLPIGEKPILEIILKNFKTFGITDVIISLGYQGELVKAFCGDGSKFGVSVQYIEEEKPLGTAGPLSLMRDFFSEGEKIVLMNGDIFTELDFSKMIDYHNNGKYCMTIGYRTYEHKLPFGVLELEDTKLRCIVEKPSTNFNVSAGIYVFDASVIDFVPDNAFFTMPDLANKLLEEKYDIGTYHIEEYWLGIENIGHFNEAIKQLDKVESLAKERSVRD
ncbi:MAG: NTP transferase domain-containing protein [Deltaproteobacteria bacterium]|nr:NTP transferase domain-containing protein [Deltaproteobacteria bacterium]